jgi:hypothetical protein|eukprot:scaffold1308_cov246-Chaetoceros_neogracile.AAC.15
MIFLRACKKAFHPPLAAFFQDFNFLQETGAPPIRRSQRSGSVTGHTGYTHHDGFNKPQPIQSILFDVEKE